MIQEFPLNPGDGSNEQAIHDVSVVNSQNVTFNQTQIIQISVEEIKTRALITTSPYKGLKTFELEDKERFFGRDQCLTGLVNELEQTNLILLLGASGSGKSSVIRAGLIPWLAQKWGSHFVSLVFTPDQDPFDSLYGSLLGKYKQSDAQLARLVQPETLTQVVRSLKYEDDYWFILIDQFEELFTTSESGKRDVFIQGLVNLVNTLNKKGDRSVKLVATMRADFLDRLSPYPALIKLTDKHRPMIADLQVDELRLAIEQPAAHHGVVFESGLVKEIINDVQGQAGYLPLLQYTLNLLWEMEVKTESIEDRTLNLSNYHKLGGVRGALQQHIDRIYSALSESEQLATQRIFLKLVDIGTDTKSGTDWKPVRRRANRSEFSDPLEQTVLTQLVNQNLLVSNRAKESQDSTIEIAHEVLLTSWTTLNNWITENRQAIALRNRLNDDVIQWQKTQSSEDLWSGSRLEQALERRQDQTFNQVLGGFSPTTNQFLDESQGKREREANKKKRTKLIIRSASLVVAFLLGSTLTVTFYLQQQTKRQRVETLTATGISLLPTEPTKGLSYIIAATGLSQSFIVRFPNNPVPNSVQDALFEAIQDSREKNLLWHGSRVLSVAISDDGEIIASAGKDGTIRLWRVEDGSPLGDPFGENDSEIRSIDFSPDGNYLVTGSLGGSIRLWDIQGNRLPISFRGHSQLVFSVAFSPDAQRIISGGADGTVRLWDLQGSQIGEPFQGHEKTVFSVAFSPDAQRIISGGADGTVRLWDLQGNQIGKPFKGHQGGVFSVAFDSREGENFISAGSDRKIQIWNTERTPWITTYKPFEGHTNMILSALFISGSNKDFQGSEAEEYPDTGKIVSGSGDGTIRLWDLHGDAIEPSFQGHKGWVTSLALSPDHKTLVSGSGDGTVRVWDLREGNMMSQTQYTGEYIPGTLEAALDIACRRLRHHPVLTNPQDEIARGARETCQSYAPSWQVE